MAAKKKKTDTELVALDDPRAPLDSALFLARAQGLLAELEADLLERARGSVAVRQALGVRHEAERAARRTADPQQVWERHFVTQVAASWVLSCVFVRTLEDRGLLGQHRIAGAGALDSQRLFFETAPSLTEREYLLTVFRELTRIPAARDLFDARHNPVWLLGPSSAMAKKLLLLFRAPNADAPGFRFGQKDTRFLGDLYQDLSADVRERFALLQTPHFVESYILDRTLERAIARFGLDETTLIDPTCGSGHFLIGAFERLFEHRLRKEPGLDVREAARRSMDAVFGSDINPYAVAIARFRLTLSFIERAGYARIADAPELPLHVVVADSLLHAPLQRSLGELAQTSAQTWSGDEFALEDESAAKDVLYRKYAAVVGNPPYITVKDPVLRERYRDMYPRSAAGKYSVAAPFTERFFLLAREAGFVGMITANSFMKREFGKKLIEEFLPTVNLDGVVNTSGAYIPGHGTPTVLLFGSHEAKQGSDVLAVLAKRGEPSTPSDPEQGLVWRSIADHGAEIGFENDYVSVSNVTRGALEKHPWSLGGGGASELKELLEERAATPLGQISDSIGIASFTLEDDVFLQPEAAWLRLGVPRTRLRPMVIGEVVRDWCVSETPAAFFPYDASLRSIEPFNLDLNVLWRFRSNLSNNKLFGGTTKVEGGLRWYEYGRLTTDKLRTPLTITFAFVATHNHFVLDRGGKVFKQSAPIIKLKDDATEDDHLALLAYLNSSTACFWMKQVMMNKGGSGIGRGVQDEAWEARFEFDGTKMATIPIPPNWLSLAPLAREMEQLVAARTEASPRRRVESALSGHEVPRSEDAGAKEREIVARMVALQERIDFEVYELFGLLDRVPELPPSIAPGARAFEVQLQRSGARTAWFDRHAYDRPDPRLPGLDELSLPAEVRLIEEPTFKRRWLVTAWNAEQDEARDLGRLTLIEDEVKRTTDVTGVRDVEQRLATSKPFQSLSRFDHTEDGDPRDFVAALLLCECAPFLAAFRHTDAGMEKRAAWERVWDLQRAEDRGEQVPAFDPPPKYDQKDYRDPNCWRLRGKLDVPKERFISYPGCESDEDKEPVYGWAGWNHLQQAQALAALYQKRKTEESWEKGRLTPMLAGLLELIPWVKQWHNEPSAEFGGLRLGDYFETFLDGQCHELGLTRDDLRAWRPAEKTRGKKRSLPPPAKASDEEASAEASAKPKGRRKKSAPAAETEGE
jgi:hypothetical protein